MSPREPSIKRNSLLALGSAAVIAVYAAGYARTRSAAAAFAVETTARRPVPAARPVAAAPPAVVVEAPSKPQEVQPPAPAKLKKPVSAKVSETPHKTTPAPADSTPSPAVVALPPQPDSLTATRDSASMPADSPRVVYKDGKYFGYGMSRHGDIEAAVEIKNGRISAAYISQCLTRYSCSWISTLPGQVVTRQSPEVDYISGATQSTNAFYDAIVQALAKAK